MNRILILIFLSSSLSVANAQKLKVKIKPDVVYFIQGKNNILNYQVAEKSFNGTYPRTNYIHPLYSLDGQVLTENPSASQRYFLDMAPIIH